MATFTVRTINSTFSTEVEVTDQSRADDALAFGVRGALMIAADEIHGGTAASIVDVTVLDESGTLVRRSAVSVSVAPLAVGSVEQREMPAGIRNR